jgi:hypothetical protein
MQLINPVREVHRTSKTGPLARVKIHRCYFFMIGGSPAPPYCPRRRFESCSDGCCVCDELTSRLLRLEVFCFSLARLFVFLVFAIHPPIIYYDGLDNLPLVRPEDTKEQALQGEAEHSWVSESGKTYAKITEDPYIDTEIRPRDRIAHDAAILTFLRDPIRFDVGKKIVASLEGPNQKNPCCS